MGCCQSCLKHDKVGLSEESDYGVILRKQPCKQNKFDNIECSYLSINDASQQSNFSEVAQYSLEYDLVDLKQMIENNSEIVYDWSHDDQIGK